MPFLPALIMQIAVILVAARGVGGLFRRIHQPQVVGEMVAGILLGPSLLGWGAPGVSALLFPSRASRPQRAEPGRAPAVHVPCRARA